MRCHFPALPGGGNCPCPSFPLAWHCISATIGLDSLLCFGASSRSGGGGDRLEVMDRCGIPAWWLECGVAPRYGCTSPSAATTT